MPDNWTAPSSDNLIAKKASSFKPNLSRKNAPPCQIVHFMADMKLGLKDPETDKIIGEVHDATAHVLAN